MPLSASCYFHDLLMGDSELWGNYLGIIMDLCGSIRMMGAHGSGQVCITCSIEDGTAVEVSA